MVIIIKIQMILIPISLNMDLKVYKIEEKQFKIKTFLLKRTKEYSKINIKKSKNPQRNKFIIQMLWKQADYKVKIFQ